MKHSALLRSVLALLIRSWARCSDSRAALVVCYHRVDDPPGDPDTELVPSTGVALLRKQLAHLRRGYHVVPLSQLREAGRQRPRRARFPVAITFDDDLASHAAVAVPELRKAQLPATFFLSGRSLNGPARFWWEDLQLLVSSGRGVSLPELGACAAVGPHNIKEAAARLELLPPSDRDHVANRLRDLARSFPLGAGLDAAAVERIAEAGFEVGFHTRGHYVFTTADDQLLDRELRVGRGELERVAGAPIRALAYPHGKADDRSAQAVRAAGYAHAFTSEPTAITPRDNPFLLGRVDAPPESRGHFALALARAITRTS